MRQIPTKVNGDTVEAFEWNPAQDEIENVVTDTGQALNPTDNYQVSKSVSNYVGGGDFYADTGSVNAYQLSPIGSKQVPTSYADGIRVRFIPANNNTGASTLKILGLTSKDIKKGFVTSPNPIIAGDLSSNYLTEAFFSAANDCFILSPASATQIIIISQIPTGMVMHSPCLKSNTPSGWVIMDDGTIGDATSGASTRANADCQNLFVFLWNNVSDFGAPVSGGRGVNALADWNAHKNIKVLSTSNRSIINAADTANDLGAIIGQSEVSLSEDQLAKHLHKYLQRYSSGFGDDLQVGSSIYTFYQNDTNPNTTSIGNNSPISILPPSVYMNSFIKL
jgi:hypothetical protein